MRRGFGWSHLWSVALVCLALGVTACSGSDTGGTPSAAANDVTFVATEYAFSGPDTIAAGWTTIHLRNDGKELHHLGLMKLDEGKTMADVEALMASGADAPDFIQFFGGPNAVIGPIEGAATVNLEEGNYVALCVIPGADGVPHAAKGMMKAITVSGQGGASAPVADMTVELADFTFVHDAPFSAGKHTIEVTNTAKQPHEIVIVKLDPGKTAADFVGAFAPGAPPGPPPGTPMGGLSPIAPGQVAYFDTDLVPGNYAAICFLDDAASQKIHAELGMMEEFTIK